MVVAKKRTQLCAGLAVCISQHAAPAHTSDAEICDDLLQHDLRTTIIFDITRHRLYRLSSSIRYVDSNAQRTDQTDFDFENPISILPPTAPYDLEQH